MHDNRIIQIHDRSFRLYLSRVEIEKRIDELSEKIRHEYNDKKIVYVIVLKGAMVFAMDLIRAVSVPCQLEVVSASSYGNAIESSGAISFHFPPSLKSLHDKDVIIVEDIVDTGQTIVQLQRELQKYSPRSIRIATLLFKSGVYAEALPIEYIGFDIAPAFVVGYGMDYAESGRELADIYILHENQEAKS